MIKDIIFFEDFGLYSRCELEAIKRGQKLAAFFIDCVSTYLGKLGESGTYKKTEMFYVACQEQAEKEGIAIAELIEKACADFFEVSVPKAKPKKGSIFDLNRDAKEG